MLTRTNPTARFFIVPPVFAITFFLASWLTGCSGSSAGSGTQPSGPPPASNNPFWAQWGSTPQHTGTTSVAAQQLNKKIADIVYDPFVTQEQAEEGGDLVAHYQATLTDGNDFYMENKSGTYPSCNPVGDWVNGTACGPNAWNQLIWNVTRYTWESGQPVLIWTFQSDWKPEPNVTGGLGGWEPVFHPVLANSFIYVPRAGGTVWKVDKNTGKSVSQINPFASGAVDAKNTFVSGPLSVDTVGNVYYNVIELADPAVTDPWFGSDVLGAWLVKVTSADVASTATYASLVPNTPIGSAANCPGRFLTLTPTPAFPWPPTPTSVPPTLACGSQRPGVNMALAIAADGTIYTASRAHFDSMVSYLVAVNPDLTPKWQASMQLLLQDGFGVLLPIAIANNTTTPHVCTKGTTQDAAPTQNALGSGKIFDQASSTPTVLPDGGVLFGALDNYNYA